MRIAPFFFVSLPAESSAGMPHVKMENGWICVAVSIVKTMSSTVHENVLFAQDNYKEDKNDSQQVMKSAFCS